MSIETPEWTGPERFLPPTPATHHPDGARHHSGVTYAVAFGYRPLQLDLWVPGTAVRPPLVIWVHGGAFMFGDRRYLPGTLRPNQVFDALLDAGLAVATIDYRHALEAPFPAQLHDAKAAVRYLRAHADELGISADRIGIWGESAGGSIAALAGLTAHRPDLEGTHGEQGPSSAVDVVVDWYGLSDLDAMPRSTLPPEMASKLPPELQQEPADQWTRGLVGAERADASPVTHVTADAPPFLLVHGTNDWLVPFAQSEILHTALASAGVSSRLVPVHDADHNFDGCADIDSVVRLSVQFIVDVLRDKPRRD